MRAGYILDHHGVSDWRAILVSCPECQPDKDCLLIIPGQVWGNGGGQGLGVGSDSCVVTRRRLLIPIATGKIVWILVVVLAVRLIVVSNVLRLHHTFKVVTSAKVAAHCDEVWQRSRICRGVLFVVWAGFFQFVPVILKPNFDLKIDINSYFIKLFSYN